MTNHWCAHLTGTPCIQICLADAYEARRHSMEIYKHEMNFRRNMTLILIVVLIIFVLFFMWFNAPEHAFFPPE